MDQVETEKLIEHYGSIFATFSHSALSLGGRPSKEDLIKHVARLRELVMALPEDRKMVASYGPLTQDAARGNL